MLAIHDGGDSTKPFHRVLAVWDPPDWAWICEVQKMRKQQDPYSLANIVAAINIAGPHLTPAEKREVLERMTAEIERIAAEKRSANTSSVPITER